MTVDLVGAICDLHRALDDAEIPHAFGGALALAWCTERARGTIDIDLNCFVTTERVDDLLAALGDEVVASEAEVQLLERDGQVRARYRGIPLDLFINTTPFHEGLVDRVRVEAFAGSTVPFLSCTDLAVFKAAFNRPKDWVDLAEMDAAGSLDLDVAVGVLARYLGPSDERIARLLTLAGPKGPDATPAG